MSKIHCYHKICNYVCMVICNYNNELLNDKINYFFFIY